MFVTEAQRNVKVAREKTDKKLTEDDILKVLKRTCDPLTPEGEWLASLDIVPSGNVLQLVKQTSYGLCRVECRTIALVCQTVLDESEEELIELMYQESTAVGTMIDVACKKQTKVCVTEAPPIPSTRTFDEDFIPQAPENRALDTFSSILSNTAKDKAMVYDAKLRDQFGSRDPKTKKKTKLGPGSGKPHPLKKTPKDEL